MNALETIFQHKSIRKFTDKPVDQNTIDLILKAAFRGSTTGNMQVYSIMVTQDLENKKKILPFHFNQQMVVNAPLVLTFNADFNRFNLWCEQRNALPGYDNFLSFMTGTIDAVIAAQNATLAAEALGLGVCYLGTTIYTADKLIKHFELPNGVVPITTLVIGYPAENPDLVDRLPSKGIVHYEKYNQFSPVDIDEIYFEKENLDLTKSLIAENKTENLAQIFTQKRYTKETNVLFSKVILEVLEKQGFMNNL
jgi:FMN reductase (NADPH)